MGRGADRTRPGWTTRLRRHPFPVQAHFEDSLVLAYAVAAERLAPLLPPGLRVDAWKGWGFVAAAFVQTKALRPQGFPRALGQDFFLSGYRVFTRFPTASGRTLRGLRILRSDTDRRRMAWFGNRLTHYGYRPCRATAVRADGRLRVQVQSGDGKADVDVVADLRPAKSPPEGSPFRTLHDARKFAGPLPFTFDYEESTRSMVVVEGQRTGWDPQPVDVDVRRLSFLDSLGTGEAVLASAFWVSGVDYRWKRGVVEPLPEGTP